MKKALSVLVAIAFSIFLGWSSIALAAIDAVGAEALKKQVNDSLQWRLNMAKSLKQGLEMTGAVEVAPKESFYEVKLPGLAFSMGPEGKLEIGTVVLNATPGTAGEWIVSMALPSPMLARNAQNQVVATLHIGSQKFAAVWWPEKEIFSKINSEYNDLQLKVDEHPEMQFQIGGTKILMNLKDNGDGTWSGPNHFEMTTLRAVDTTDPNKADFRIQSLTAKNTYDRLNLSKAKDMRQKIEQLFQSGQEPTEADIKALVETAMEAGRDSINGMTSAFSAKGLLAKGQKPDNTPFQFELATFGLDSNMTDMMAEKGSITFGMNFDGLRALPGIPPYDEFIPGSMNLGVHITQLPVKALADVLFGAITKSLDMASASQGANPNAEMQAAFASLPQILGQAGANLAIDNTFVKSTALETTLAGNITANATAAMGATGTVTLTVTGMDEAIQKLQAEATKPGADPNMLGPVSMLTPFQLMGQSDKAADGRSIRRYAFEMTAEGKVLLNGADMSAMAGTMAPPVPEAPAAAQ